MVRVGQGFDVHRLVSGRPLWLGGVEIEHSQGLEGHSDGDALLHAIADAILGAMGAGDLGTHFPSSEERWRGVASREILTQVAARMREGGFDLGNVDATVIAEAPRLAPHQQAMRARIAESLTVSEECVNLKVTSTDGLGALGRGEGIAAQAVVVLVEKGD